MVNRRAGRFAWLFVFGLLFSGPFCAFSADEEWTFEESPAKDVVFDVTANVEVRGKLKTASEKDKTTDLDLAVDAKFDYRERRLPGAGRDAVSLRSLRQYEKAEAAINVNNNRSFSSLTKTDPLIVANGQREGLQFYRPDESMTRGELELLQMPGDGLAVLGLLPQTKVEVGQKWTVENWAAQMLTGTEALLKSSVACELESVRNQRAKIRVSGNVEGAIQGATTEIELSGHYVFDLKENFLKSLELEQTEKRSVGPVSPGMDVVATVRLVRSPTSDQGKLIASAAEKIPLEPEADALELTLQLPWNATISHSRDWHVFQRTPHQTVLRLVKGGGLIAQCNLSPLSQPENGDGLSEPDFRELVKKGLGENLESIVSSHSLESDGNLSLHRIIAKGESQKIDMTWHYYLAAEKDRQMLFFVAFETDLKDKLGEADLELVKSLKMQKPKLIPAGGEKSD